MSEAAFTDLEQTVILIARKDPVSTIEDRPMPMIARILGWPEPLPGLSNSRLEALRRLAVRLCHDAPDRAAQEVELALGVGFTATQVQSLVEQLAAVRAARARRYHWGVRP